MLTAMLTLTAAELRALTGYSLPAKQREWMDARGIPYRDEGRILVSRAVAERWLCGAEAIKSNAPDLSMVR